MKSAILIVALILSAAKDLPVQALKLVRKILMKISKMKDYFSISKILACALSVLLLSACSLLGPTKNLPTTRYEINSLPSVSHHHRPRFSLLVSMPCTKPVFNTTDMLYSEHPHEIEAYGLNQWAKPPAQMLQSLIIQTLVRTGAFKAVLGRSSGNFAYEVKTHIFDFRQNYLPGLSEFRLSVQVTLIRMRDQKIVASKIITVCVPISQPSPKAGAAAGNRANAIMLARLANFVLRHLT